MTIGMRIAFKMAAEAVVRRQSTRRSWPWPGLLPPALAEDVCPERRAILYLSNTVLTHRQSVDPEEVRRFGTAAAYLTLRYTPLEGQDGDEFVRSLLGEDMLGIRDLAFAWFVSTGSMARAAQELGVEAAAS
jgi:hypothetical protein